MKTAVVAVTPTIHEKPAELERLCAQLGQLQERGLMRTISVAAIMHPDLYPYPSDYYQLVKTGLSRQARLELEKNMRSKIAFRKIHMLTAPNSENLTLAQKLSDFAERRRADVLVVSRPRNPGWFRRLIHRVAEATAYSASVPVLVLSPEGSVAGLEARILLAVDARRLPTEGELEHVAAAARLMGAEVHILHVRPANRSFSKPLNLRLPASLVMRKLGRMEAFFARRCIGSKSVLAEEDESVAAAVERYAAAHGICLTAVTLPRKSLVRRLVQGSTVKRLLKLSRRPVLVLRPRENAGTRQKATSRGIFA